MRGAATASMSPRGGGLGVDDADDALEGVLALAQRASLMLASGAMAGSCCLQRIGNDC